jgi:hypothetical protein
MLSVMVKTIVITFGDAYGVTAISIILMLTICEVLQSHFLDCLELCRICK